MITVGHQIYSFQTESGAQRANPQAWNSSFAQIDPSASALFSKE